MRLDIRELPACDWCPRQQIDTANLNQQDAVKAGACLLIEACQSAGREYLMANDQDSAEQQAQAFLFASPLIDRRSKGAVGTCGRIIGRGQCPNYSVSSQNKKEVIVYRSGDVD